ncbi:MAG: AAA family ATPase [Thermodesulfovibrionia bacterium]|nr:AAA family ATPase [Thermodesulfovibrionia bacterium]
MDYLNFFGFKEDPFKLTPDPAYFYPSSSHNEGLLLMDYSIQQKEGFLLIIGDPGTGKTTLLNVFLEKWKLRAEIAIILTPRLSPEEFLISVVDDLNINLENRNKNEIIKALRDFMIKKSIEDKRIVIVVDEAQNLPDETLEELRLLSNLETDKDKLIQIILTGQPELESKLMTERLRQLNQRITTRIHLKRFNPDETRDYINYRLIKAGKRNLKIDKKAGKLVHKLSNGVPRLINMLISRALMAAYLEESNIISQRHITHAVKSLGHSELKIQGQNRLIPLYAGLSFILLSGVGGYFYLQNTLTRTQNTEHRAQSTEVRSQNIEDKKLGRLEDEKLKNTTSQPLNFSTSEPMNSQLQINKIAPFPASPTTVEEESQGIGAGQYIIVKFDVANIREMPSLDSKEVGWASKGSQFVVLQEHIDNKDNIIWYQVPYHGEKRWISGYVVDIVKVKE